MNRRPHWLQSQDGVPKGKPHLLGFAVSMENQRDTAGSFWCRPKTETAFAWVAKVNQRTHWNFWCRPKTETAFAWVAKAKHRRTPIGICVSPKSRNRIYLGCKSFWVAQKQKPHLLGLQKLTTDGHRWEFLGRPKAETAFAWVAKVNHRRTPMGISGSPKSRNRICLGCKS